MAHGVYAGASTDGNVGVNTTTETSGNLNDFIKRYMPYKMLRQEVEKRTWFLQKVNKKQDFKGGLVEVHFKAVKASSFRMGRLVKADEITSSKYVKGFVQGYKEIWGAMKFLDHDLARHDDLKQSFVDALLKELPDFANGMSDRISSALLNGANITRVVAAGTAGGVVKVARPETLEVGMRVEFGDVTVTNGAGVISGYIAAIDMGDATGGTVSIVTAESDVLAGTNPVNCTTVLVGWAARLEDGFGLAASAATALNFTSLPEQLLAAANGGAATHFGLSKVKYPFLQAYNHNLGGSATSQDIVDGIFDTLTLHKRQCKTSRVTDVVCDYVTFSNVIKAIELGQLTGHGNREYTTSDRKINAYGWTEITVESLGHKVNLVGINELDGEHIFGIDWAALDLLSNGMIERRKSPDGKEFYEVRNETDANSGFQYIVDIRFFGELVVSEPYKMFILHNL